MKFFNSIQFVGLFSVAPFLINLLEKQSFNDSSVLFYSCWCIYTTMFFFISVCVNFGACTAKEEIIRPFVKVLKFLFS